MSDQITLRDTLEANMDALESGTIEVPKDAPALESELSETPEAKADRERDEIGRFKAKESAPIVPDEVIPPEPALQRPTTWKKEYVPMWDKLAQGLPLTPEEAKQLAAYSNQRETEYKSGVSTYRAEAQNAKELNDALAPFMPTFQQYNITPAAWIRDAAQAHQVLAQGSPEQKLQIFAKMAQDFGVPLHAIGAHQQGQLDPIVPQLMQQIQALSGQVNTVTSWREQQQEAEIQQQIAKLQDTEKYPHFEQVRKTMGQLLESGLVPSLDDAYVKAVRMNDDVWKVEQERQANATTAQQQAIKAAAVAKAKSQAVSTRTSTPSGSVSTGGKGLRDVLESNFDSLMSSRV